MNPRNSLFERHKSLPVLFIIIDFEVTTGRLIKRSSRRFHMRMIQEVLEQSIAEYNDLRNSYARVKLLEGRNDKFTVYFGGYYCRSYCMDDYFLDLVYALEEKGVKAEFVNFQSRGLCRIRG